MSDPYTMHKTKTGILISSSFGKIIGLLPMIQRDIIQTLYVTLYPIEDKSSQSTTLSLPVLSSNVIGTYAKTIAYNNLDVRILLNKFRSKPVRDIITSKPIDIIYLDKVIKQECVTSMIVNKAIDFQTVLLDSSVVYENEFESKEFQSKCTGNVNQMYNHTVLGGTFDHLHAGHKILLSEAVLRSSNKVTVGVTDIHMLHAKKVWEIIEPCPVRIQKVREFLQDVDPSLHYDIVPIDDIYGPTKDDPSFEMLVVSAETAGGGVKVNELRTSRGLNALDVVAVPLLPAMDKVDAQEEDKVSSSNLRMRTLGTLTKPVQPKPGLSDHPYLIGLTGGIAAGKSTIGKWLQELGAGHVDCDQLGHRIYDVGTPGNAKIRELFGEDVALPDGTIDRKKLGAIVFSDPNEMKKLNSAMWPLILAKAKEEIQRFKESHDVVVVEAAVLMSARWLDEFHEIWVVFIPMEEAIKRLKSRNNLSETEAKLRIKSQPSNSEFVSHANVLLSSAWDTSYTKIQVERAYKSLLQRLPKNNLSTKEKQKL